MGFVKVSETLLPFEKKRTWANDDTIANPADLWDLKDIR